MTNAVTSTFCRCKCFFKSNVYLKDYNLHVTYQDEMHFTKHYAATLADLGCQDLKSVVSEIESELKRRKNDYNDTLTRTRFIRENYKPLHPSIHELSDSVIHPDLIDILATLNSDPTNPLLNKHIKRYPSQVFSFQLFRAEFCQKLVEELDHFNKSSMPKGRPNSMNHHGVLLDELGFNEKLLIPLRHKMEPLIKLLFPSESQGAFDTHKVFTVDYEVGSKDTELGFHFDNSEVTLNVCLLADAEGGELYFGPSDRSKGFGYEHEIGRAVMHRGSSLHCVLPLNAGRRVNLVMWMRNSRVRNKRCPLCKNVPDLEPVAQGWADGFTQN